MRPHPDKADGLDGYGNNEDTRNQMENFQIYA